jgi:hypothetical protein
MPIDKFAQEFLNQGGGPIEKHKGAVSDGEMRQARFQAARSKEWVERSARFTEEILNWFNARSLELDLDPEQRIFAVCLATINLRQHFPADKGGKEFFDEVSHKAWEYYAANTQG